MKTNKTIAGIIFSACLMVTIGSAAETSKENRLNFRSCQTHPSGAVKACITQDSKGYLIEMNTDRIISGPFGFEPSNNYGGQSPGLKCNDAFFDETRFGEKLAVFNCEGFDLSSNFCGKGHGAGYRKQQNEINDRLPPNIDFNLKLNFKLDVSQTKLILKSGDFEYRYKFESQVKSVNALSDYVRNDLGQVLRGNEYLRVELTDGKVHYYYGYREHYFYRSGLLSANTNLFCL
jgi:hypothetical protein